MTDRRICAILNCANSDKKSRNINTRYYGLPNDPAVCRTWLQWISRINFFDVHTVPSGKIHLCSDHFEDKFKGKRKLKAGAIPSLQKKNLNTQLQDLEQETDQSDTNNLDPGNANEVSDSRPASVQQLEDLKQETNQKGTNNPDPARANQVPDTRPASVNQAACSSKDNPAKFDFKQDNPEISDFVQCPPGKSSSSRQVATSSKEVEILNPVRDGSGAYYVDSTTGVPFAYIEGSVLDASNSFDEEMFFKDNIFDCLPTVSLDKLPEGTLTLELAGPNIHRVFDEPVMLKTTSARKKGQTKAKRKCSALGCIGSASNKYFKFPCIDKSNQENFENVERCKEWVKNSGNMSLLEKPTKLLYKNNQLCSEHFQNDMFYNSDRRRLLPHKAVPTVFSPDCIPLTEAQMSVFPVLSDHNILMGESTSGLENAFDDLNNNIETNDKRDKRQKDFEENMFSIKWVSCPKCKERFSKHSASKIGCLHSKNTCSHYSESNDMDPGDVPPELAELSYIEEQLIARVHPLISVFKLSGHHQYGYRGNIINFHQDVNSVAKALPHNVQNLPSVVTVRTGDALKPVDFHVRRDKIREALLWLKVKNRYYYDIEISEPALQALPEDGNLFDQVTSVINMDGDEDEVEETELGDDNDRGSNPLVKETCVPTFSPPSSKEKAESILQWPAIDKNAINEFKTPGYIAMAFPCLFPEGKTDLRNPRGEEIKPLQYFKHLFRYKDERFAKHPRFRYFALNSIMRWAALRNGGLCVQKNSDLKNMTVKQLKEEVKENPNLLKKLMFYNSNLRGTKAFWYSKGQQLLAMIEQLGLPTLFFTLSAADLHWPDLFHYLAPEENLNTMTETRRRKLVEENPLKVDSFFMERGNEFITKVLKTKFKVKDLWFRIEYQHRGSPHIHGILWLDGAPKFTDLAKASSEELHAIAMYFDKYISTTHPDIQCPKGPVHPCRIRLSEILDVDKDIAELLNRVQRHTEHREGYCLRKNKKTGKLECRFKFPKEEACATEIKIKEDHDVELVTARNDRYLNKYNQYIIQTWRANIDVSAVLSKRALINYLAKYVAKAETKSKELTDVLQTLFSNSDDEKSAKSLIQRLYIQSCCERDISAQESCHLLMGLTLCSAGGRIFVPLNFKVLETDGWVSISEDDTNASKSYIEKYMERNDRFKERSLWDMAKNVKLPSGKSYAKEAIVQVYPRLSKNCMQTDPEAFYRQKVLLFVPWKYEEQFTERYGTWEQAYKANQILIEASFKPSCDLDGVEPDDPEYEDIDPDDGLATEQWMCISRMGPSQLAEKIELGRRDIDLNFNWHEAAEKYAKHGGIDILKNFISDERKKHCTETERPIMPSVNFTKDQETVLNLLKQQIEFLKQNLPGVPSNLPKSVIVQGKAGTGKSLLIHAMKTKIYEAFGEDAFVLLGPTGVSALNINGSTIHSKLHVHPKSKELMPLAKSAQYEFRQKFEKVLFVIVDEYSMVGCNMVDIIEKRLKEAMDRENQEFGGVFIYFFGDIQQLAPVGDSAAYKKNQVSISYINGRLLYQNIDGAIVLSEVKRQNDVGFLNVLNNISTGRVTRADYDILCKRFKTSVSEDERKTFADAIHLFPRRIEVDQFNKEKLENLKDPVTNEPVPIARIPATHNCPAAKDGTENDSGGLSPVLYLAKGAKIMLRCNLWTERGLVNGAVGTVVDILYKPGSSPPDSPPDAIVCRFDLYKGPYLDNMEKTVVIQATTSQWKSKSGTDCTRTQFPLSLCYACSIHKSQGLTLEKAFVNIGILKEMQPGLTYTALSRVKSLAGLLLEPFGFQRLQKLNDRKYMKERQEWIEQLTKKHICNYGSYSL